MSDIDNEIKEATEKIITILDSFDDIQQRIIMTKVKINRLEDLVAGYAVSRFLKKNFQ